MRTLRTAEPSPTSLLGDQSGAVMVIGIAMGTLLACAIWYLVGVGNAIVNQERLQDAADATAYQVAVWHARGMNLISLMNMAMAVILTIIVAFRVVEAVVAGLLILCHAVTLLFAPAELGCGALDVAVLAQIVTLESRVSNFVLWTMQGISWAEAGTAIVVPHLARGRGIEKTTSFYRTQGVLDRSSVYTLSLLPTSLDLALKVAGTAAKPRIGWWGSAAAIGGGIASSVNQEDFTPLAKSITEGWPSLPLQQDSFEQVCSRTGELVMSSADGLSALMTPGLGAGTGATRLLPSAFGPGFDEPKQLVRMVVGDLFGAGSIVLCEPLPGMIVKSIEALAHAPGWVADRAMDAPGAGEILDLVQSGPFEDFLTTSSDKVHPAKLWMFAHNGNAVLRTWASVGRSAPSRGSFFRSISSSPGQAVASAEYYSSCYSLDSFSPTNALLGALVRDCEDDAMWRIGWSARMRRVRPVLDELYLEQIAGDLLVEKVSDRLPEAIRDLTPIANLDNWTFRNDFSPAKKLLNQLFGSQERDQSDIIH